MEDLFETNLNIDNRDLAYHVVFEEEEYRFKPIDGGPSLSFKREHDEWVPTREMESILKTQAVNALEKYLLRQH